MGLVGSGIEMGFKDDSEGKEILEFVDGGEIRRIEMQARARARAGGRHSRMDSYKPGANTSAQIPDTCHFCEIVAFLALFLVMLSEVDIVRGLRGVPWAVVPLVVDSRDNSAGGVKAVQVSGRVEEGELRVLDGGFGGGRQ